MTLHRGPQDVDPFQAVDLHVRCGIKKQLGIFGKGVKGIPGAKSPRSPTDEGRQASAEAGDVKPVLVPRS